MTATAAGQSGTGAPSAGSWALLFEDLLSGIVHSINNTLTVIGVSLELASTADAAGELAAMRREVAHLERFIALITVISSKSAPAEALEIQAVIDLALSIHAFSNPTRTVSHTLHIVGEIPPVRAPHATLLHLMLLLIDGAKHASLVGGATAHIEIDGDAERVSIRAPGPTFSPVDAIPLAAACGGTFVVTDGIQVLELPSLQSLRRAKATMTPDRTLMPRSAAES